MSDEKKKRISKKRKSAWRKTDITDVEEYLEEKRQEERIGSVHDKKDEDLFVVDKVQKAGRLALTPKQKRKLNAKKPLRSLQALINTSKVEDPIKKRNHVKQKKNGRTVEEEVRNPTKPRHFQANKDREKYYEKLNNKPKDKTNFDKDIWAEKDFRDEIPGLKDEKGWISHKLSVHVANNIGKKVVKPHDGLRHRTTKAKNFEPPHPGMSYNPSLEAHQDLIAKVVEKEEKIIKEEKHLKRITTEMFSKVTPEERDRNYLAEMSTGLDEDIIKEKPDDDIENDAEYVSVNPPVENKKKTTQIRNKEMRHKELLKKHAEKKALKKHLAELNRLKSLKKEVIAEEVKVDELMKRRKKTEFKKKFEPKRLSRVKYVEPDVDVNMAEDIAGNLRNVKTESSLLVDRFKNFQKRNILPASVAANKQKRRKIKRFPRSSHKEPGVSFQDLREKRKTLVS